ncbi:MAG: glycosyltransferase [Pseudomonadota bacterium]|nr:glycosyltransferase [Pseudomonadota bacterium]
MKKVLCVYQYVAKYREPIFNELFNCDDLNFYLAAGNHSNTDIKLLDSGNSILNSDDFILLKNRWFGSFLWQTGLMRTLIKGRYDSVIFLGDPHFISTWFCLLYCKFFNIQALLWTHGFVGRNNKVKDFVKTTMYKLADKILLYGNNAKEDLIKIGISSSKIEVIYNSLDYDNQKSYREIYDTNLHREFDIDFKNKDLKTIFFVGRLTKHKKLHQILQAMKLLQNKGCFVNCLFIGDGVEIKNLKDLVRTLELTDYVNFYGSCHDERVLAALICNSDVCVAPGEIGLTAMHSLAYGKPAITHNNDKKQMPEYEAIREGVSGYLFVENDIHSLAIKIETSIKGDQSFYKKNCINIIESYYTPKKQLTKILRSLEIE